MTVFSSRYVVESDLNRLAILTESQDHSVLSKLSRILNEIEEDVFRSVEDRLNVYKNKHQDSPVFSVATLFGPIDYGRLETATTRAIAWLIDPEQPHGFGCDVADLVMRLVDERGGGSRRLRSVSAVIPEKRTKRGGRIDVWAEGRWNDGARWTLLIEAKIDAVESQDQLKRYEDEVRGIPEWIGIFLTRDGSMPTSSNAKWKSLSFQALANALVRYYTSAGRGKRGSDFLRLFAAGILRDILERPVPIAIKQNNRFEIADLLGPDTRSSS
ncbi:MAG: PD-(D/E)XK nuclease family protein [Sulfuricaulis sp.]